MPEKLPVEETEAERDKRLGQITLPRSGEPGAPDGPPLTDSAKKKPAAP